MPRLYSPPRGPARVVDTRIWPRSGAGARQSSSARPYSRSQSSCISASLRMAFTASSSCRFAALPVPAAEGLAARVQEEQGAVRQRVAAEGEVGLPAPQDLLQGRTGGGVGAEPAQRPGTHQQQRRGQIVGVQQALGLCHHVDVASQLGRQRTARQGQRQRRRQAGQRRQRRLRLAGLAQGMGQRQEHGFLAEEHRNLDPLGHLHPGDHAGQVLAGVAVGVVVVPSLRPCCRSSDARRCPPWAYASSPAMR